MPASQALEPPKCRSGQLMRCPRTSVAKCIGVYQNDVAWIVPGGISTCRHTLFSNRAVQHPCRSFVVRLELLVLVVASAVVGCRAVPVRSGDLKSDRDLILQLEARRGAGYEEKDTAAVAALFAPGYFLITPWGEVKDSAAALEGIMSHSDFFVRDSARTSQEFVRFHGQSALVSRRVDIYFSDMRKDPPAPLSIHDRILNVWVRSETGEWKLASTQVTRMEMRGNR